MFLALMKWAEVNEMFDDQLEPLLDLVRFKSMTINYLHDVVTSDHPIASTVAKFPLLFEEAVFYHAFSKVCAQKCVQSAKNGWVGLTFTFILDVLCRRAILPCRGADVSILWHFAGKTCKFNSN